MNELMVFDNPEFGGIRAVEVDGERFVNFRNLYRLRRGQKTPRADTQGG